MSFFRVMYIENKSGGVTGLAKVGRVKFSRTMRTMFYDGKEFLKVKHGYKYNCIDVETGEQYWISGCKKDGNDTLYGGYKPIHIDADCRLKYCTIIREQPERIKNEFSN